MRFGSVCSGIEAASAAWHALGWRAAWVSEIEAFPSAVIAARWPGVENLGDMTSLPERILAREVEAPDVFVGGTPCQAFSVAGLRGSLSDARGNLTLTFVRIADAIDAVRRADGRAPCWVVWENVPGVLSVADNAFGAFLGGLVGGDAALEPPRGRGWTDAGVVSGPERCAAWRVLDAQFFGLAQRRRRVFVLARAGAGNWQAADALLPVIESVRWHPAPRRETGQRTAGAAATGARGGGGLGADAKLDGALIPSTGDVSHCLNASGMGRQDYETETLVAHAFDARQSDVLQYGDRTGPLDTDGHSVAVALEDPVPPLMARSSRGGAQTLSPGHQTDGHMVAVAFDTTQITSPSNYSRPQPGDPCHPLAAGAHPPAVAFDTYNQTITGDTTQTLCSRGDTPGGNAHLVPAVAVQCPGRVDAQGGKGVAGPDDPMFTLSTQHEQHGVLRAMQVRRLTPRECERLQGFPDDHTAIPWRGRPASECPDGPRHRALGNSMAVPVMRYLGERIVAVESER